VDLKLKTLKTDRHCL